MVSSSFEKAFSCITAQIDQGEDKEIRATEANDNLENTVLDYVAIKRIFSNHLGNSMHSFEQGLQWDHSERIGAKEKLYVGTQEGKPVWAYFEQKTQDNIVLKVLQEGTTTEINRTVLGTLELCSSFYVPPTFNSDYSGNVLRYLWKACFVLRRHSSGYLIKGQKSFTNHLHRGLLWYSESLTRMSSGSPLNVTTGKKHSPQRTVTQAEEPSTTTDKSSRPLIPSNGIVTSEEAAIYVPTQPQGPAQSSHAHPYPETVSSARIHSFTEPRERTQSPNELESNAIDKYNHAQFSEEFSEYVRIKEDRSNATKIQERLSGLKKDHVNKLNRLEKQRADIPDQLWEHIQQISQQVKAEYPKSPSMDVNEMEQMYDRSNKERDRRVYEVLQLSRKTDHSINKAIEAVQISIAQAEQDLKSRNEEIDKKKKRMRYLEDKWGYILENAAEDSEKVGLANKRRRIDSQARLWVEGTSNSGE